MTSFKNSGMLLSEWIKMNQANQERISNRSAASSLNSNGYPKGSNCRSIDNIQPNSPQKHFQNHSQASQDTSSVRSAQSMPSVYVRKMRLDGFDANAHLKQDTQKINKTSTTAPINLNYKAVATQNHWYKMTKKQNGVKIEQVNYEKPLILPVVVKQSSEDKGSSRSIDITGEDKSKNLHIEQRVTEKPLILPAVIKQSSEDKKSSRGTEIITEDKSRNLLVETKSKSIDSATQRHLVRHDSTVSVSSSELKDSTVQNVTTTVENKTTGNSKEILIVPVTKTKKKSEQEKIEEIKKQSIVESTLPKDSKEKVAVIQENVQSKSTDVIEEKKITEIQSINSSEDVYNLEVNNQIKKEVLKSSKNKTESQKNLENAETIDKVDAQLQAVNRENKDTKKDIKKQNKELEGSTKMQETKSRDSQNYQSEQTQKQNSEEKSHKPNEGAHLKTETNKTLQNTPKNPESTDEVNELIKKLDKVVEDNLNIIKSNEYEKFDKAEDKNELLEKILSDEFQASVDKFLNSNDYQNSFLNNVKNLAK